MSATIQTFWRISSYLFMISVLSVVRHCKMVLYADGPLCVWPERVFRLFNIPSQDDLSVVGKWFSGNRLVVNRAKTKVIALWFFIIMG